MKLNPHLGFNGQCEAAFRFYEKCLGGTIRGLWTYAGTPAEKHVPPEWANKLIHATLKVGDHLLMGADVPPGQYKQPTGFAVALHLKEPAEVERVFHALAEKGTVQMPVQKTFWSERFGMCTDQFGIPWMLNCEQEQQG
jgi:PhnB protein